MFNRLSQRTTQYTQEHSDTHSYHNENQNYTNYNRQNTSFKNSIAGTKTHNDRITRSIMAEYHTEPQPLLKSSTSNSNLHYHDHSAGSSLARSQEGNFLRSSQSVQSGLGSSMTFASMKMGLKSSTGREMIAADRRIKNQVLEDIIKGSLKGAEMTTSVRVNEILCSSGDGKRAKYRLSQCMDSEGMFYCSKCAIALIQQGYTIEEISLKVDYNRRKEECQDILSRLADSERILKEEIKKLEGERYTYALQSRMNKVEEIYDIMLVIIEQMKAKDIDTTRRSMEQAHIVRVQEVRILEQHLQQVTETKQYIQGTMNQALRELPEQEYRSLLDHHLEGVVNAEAYKPLELMVREQPMERILETIFSEISEHFRSLRSGRLSAISSSIIEERSDDFTLSDLKQKPFRNLFNEEDVSFNK